MVISSLQCSYADCINFQEPREPFYLHTKENVYMTPVEHRGGVLNHSTDPFYLHRPGESLSSYQRVRQLFAGEGKPVMPPPPPPPRDEIPSVPPPPPPQIKLTTGKQLQLTSEKKYMYNLQNHSLEYIGI